MSDEQTGTGLAAALAAFQAEIPHVGKNSSATVQGGRQHRYGDLAAITKATLFFLGRHGLSFIAKPTMHPEHGFVLSYALLHISGEAERGLYPLPGSGSPQAIGSAITYARRYCLCAVTGVAPDDDDDDATAAEHEHQRADGLPTNRDGSLSRSQTTDAQKEAAGVMTAAQQAEHTALQPKAAEVRGKVTRLRPGDDEPLSSPPPNHPVHRNPKLAADPWLDQPAGSLPRETEAEPGTITPQQQRAMHAACTGMDRDKRLATINDILAAAYPGHFPVTSSNQLSYVQAAMVLGKLAGAQR